jgi:hypothetical protein
MTDERPAPTPEPETSRGPLAFLGTQSPLKRLLLAGGGALVAFGTWQYGALPNGFTRAGLGTLGGYVIGRLLRRFAKVTLLAAGALAAGATVVGFSGLVPAEQLDQWTSRGSEWLAGAGDDVSAFLMRVAPAGVLTTVGLFAGLRRR